MAHPRRLKSIISKLVAPVVMEPWLNASCTLQRQILIATRATFTWASSLALPNKQHWPAWQPCVDIVWIRKIVAVACWWNILGKCHRSGNIAGRVIVV
jgi:hypothetical protein